MNAKQLLWNIGGALFLSDLINRVIETTKPTASLTNFIAPEIWAPTAPEHWERMRQEYRANDALLSTYIPQLSAYCP